LFEIENRAPNTVSLSLPGGQTPFESIKRVSPGGDVNAVPLELKILQRGIHDVSVRLYPDVPTVSDNVPGRDHESEKLARELASDEITRITKRLISVESRLLFA